MITLIEIFLNYQQYAVDMSTTLIVFVMFITVSHKFSRKSHDLKLQSIILHTLKELICHTSTRKCA